MASTDHPDQASMERRAQGLKACCIMRIDACGQAATSSGSPFSPTRVVLERLTAPASAVEARAWVDAWHAHLQ